MRTHVKKRRYAQHVRDMVLSEKVNTAEGSWVNGPGPATNNSFKNSLEGARGAQNKRRKRRIIVDTE